MQVIINRENASIPWGFRLKGGAEYNVPLSILKVNEGSPSFNKLECGDVIASIGNYPALNLKHEEALNIIRMFDLTLPLVIQRQQPFGFNPTRVQNKPTPVIWRPSSSSTNESHPVTTSNFSNYSNHPQSPKTHSSYNNDNYSGFTSTSSLNFNFNQPAQTYNYQPNYSSNFQSQVYQPPQQTQAPSHVPNYYQHHQLPNPSYQYQNMTQISPPQAPTPFSPSTLTSSSSIPPPPPPPPTTSSIIPPPPPVPKLSPIPPPPPLPDSFSSVNNYKTSKPKADASFNKPADASYSSSYEPSAQDKLFKVLNRSPMGQKPFSYTPGGLDLSHVRDSARVKRYESVSSENGINNNSRRQASVSSDQFNNHHQPRVQFQAPAPPPPPILQPQFNQPSKPQAFDPSQIHGVVLNRAASTSNENFNNPAQTAARSQKPAYQGSPAFGITPEQLVKPKKNEEKKDLMNQSFSFRMLNKWISDSEANTPIQLISKKDEEEQLHSPRPANLRRSEVIKALEEDELKTNQRLSQSPQSQNRTNPNFAVPSKVFQYVDKKFNDSDNRNQSIIEEPNFLNRVPAREREQEAPIQKYKGTNIPSKTFKYLQYITQNESVTETSSATNPNQAETVSFSNPPVVQTANTNKKSTFNQVLVENNSSNSSSNVLSNPTKTVKGLIQANNLAQQDSFKKSSNSISFPASFNNKPYQTNPEIYANFNTASNFASFSNDFTNNNYDNNSASSTPNTICSANLGSSSAAHIASAINASVSTHIDTALEETAAYDNNKSQAVDSTVDIKVDEQNIYHAEPVIADIIPTIEPETEPVLSSNLEEINAELNNTSISSSVNFAEPANLDGEPANLDGEPANLDANPESNEENVFSASTVLISTNETINTDINLNQTLETATSNKQQENELNIENQPIQNFQQIEETNTQNQETNVQTISAEITNLENTTNLSAQEEIVETSEF